MKYESLEGIGEPLEVDMLCFSLNCYLVLSSLMARADSEKVTRRITGAPSVMAIYREDHGLFSAGKPALIFAAWPDGYLVWSEDRIRGGAPYRTGRVEPKKVTALLSGFDNDGLFDDEKLSRANLGPDSQFTTVFIKSHDKRVKMESWHELFEADGKIVVTHKGAMSLGRRRRLDVLRKEPADYLYYRFVWNEIRGKLADLTPAESSPSSGTVIMDAGVLSWR